MEFFSSVRKQAEAAAATAATAAASISEAAASAMDTPTPRSGGPGSSGSGTPLAPTRSNASNSSLATLRSNEPCQTRMATIEMMTPRSPPDLGVPAPIAAGEAARSLVAARREALGDRWLLGLGPALASAASQQGDATAAPLAPAPSLVEPFGGEGAAGVADDGMQWLLDELVPDWSRLTVLRGGARSRKITIDEDGDEEEEEDDNQSLSEEEGETPAMQAARESSAAAQKAMEDALAASAEAMAAANSADVSSSSAQGLQLNLGNLAADSLIPRRDRSLSVADQARIASILAGEPEQDDSPPTPNGGGLDEEAEADTDDDDEDEEFEEADDDHMELAAEAGVNGTYVAVICSGLMWSRSQNLGKWKQRWFELTPTHLVYFTSTTYRDSAAGSLPDAGGQPRSAIPLAGMAAKAEELDGRQYCLTLSEYEEEEEEEEVVAESGWGVTGLLTGVVSGVAESVTNVGTGLARVSSFGRGGKTFATYLFDAESPEMLASFLYEINLAALRLRRRPEAFAQLFEKPIEKTDPEVLNDLVIDPRGSELAVTRIVKAGWMGLALPGRKPLLPGGKVRRRWHRRWVVLQGSILGCFRALEKPRPPLEDPVEPSCPCLELHGAEIARHSCAGRPFCLAITVRGRRGSSLTSTSRQAFLLECGSAEEQEKWKGALEKEAAAGRNRMGRGSIATLTSMGGRLPSVSEGAPPDSPASEGASLAGEDEEEEDEEEEDERSEAGEAKEAVEEEEEEDESGSEYETDDDESGSEYETETDEDDEEAAKVAAMPLPVSPGGSVGHKSGWVWKESDHLRNWRRRWLSCKDGMLTYTKTQPKGLGAVDVPQISLKHAHVGPPKTARARPYCFRVTLAVEGAGGSGEDGDGKAAVAEGGAAGVKYVLAADTASEKMEWLAALRENIAIAGGAAPRAREPSSRSSAGGARAGAGATSSSAGGSTGGGAETVAVEPGGKVYECLGCGHAFALAPGAEAEACPKCFSNFIVEKSE